MQSGYGSWPYLAVLKKVQNFAFLILEAAVLSTKLSSHFLIFYLENFTLCLSELLSFHFVSVPDPYPDPIPLGQKVPDPTGSTTLLF